jgi:CRISPR-associated exonuclease Cas4
LVRKGLNGLGWEEVDSVEQYQPGVKSVVHQEVVSGPRGHEYITAHLDFVFVTRRELVIKEMKSAATLPLSPYMSHVHQTTIQMWMLKEKYPDRDVRASVVYHDWATGESIDYPIEFNNANLEVALKQCETLWESFQTKIAPIPTRQLYCSSCPFKGTCPVLLFGSETDFPEELNEIVENFDRFKAEKKSMQKLQSNLMALMTSAGYKKATFGGITVEIINGRFGPFLKVT